MELTFMLVFRLYFTVCVGGIVVMDV